MKKCNLLNSKINMFLDAKAEVAIVREVLLSQLVLLNLETTLQNLLSLSSPDCAVDGDLLVPPDTERSNGVAGFREDWCLTSQRL